MRKPMYHSEVEQDKGPRSSDDIRAVRLSVAPCSSSWTRVWCSSRNASSAGDAKYTLVAALRVFPNRTETLRGFARGPQAFEELSSRPCHSRAKYTYDPWHC